jgi:hypothetical protein
MSHKIILALTAVAVLGAVALAPISASARGFGAVAVGASPDGASITTTINNKASEDEARREALRACVNFKYGAAEARSRCAVVAAFENQCAATAGPAWAVAATDQAAREEVVAKCRAAARHPAVCNTVSATCDTTP